MFGASAQSGAIVANGSLQQVKAAFDYGYNMGLAFQIIDDIMDYSSSKTKMGKIKVMISSLAKQHYLSFLLGRKVINLNENFFLNHYKN